LRVLRVLGVLGVLGALALLVGNMNDEDYAEACEFNEKEASNVHDRDVV
jgi:hypothetical protein